MLLGVHMKPVCQGYTMKPARLERILDEDGINRGPPKVERNTIPSLNLQAIHRLKDNSALTAS